MQSTVRSSQGRHKPGLLKEQSEDGTSLEDRLKREGLERAVAGGCHVEKHELYHLVFRDSGLRDTSEIPITKSTQFLTKGYSEGRQGEPRGLAGCGALL